MSSNATTTTNSKSNTKINKKTCVSSPLEGSLGIMSNPCARRAFIGANRQLQEDVVAWYTDNNQKLLAAMGTQWHFITPNAPHHGGLWEAAVKSAKHHLVRCVSAQTMLYSQMQTLATLVEACLNSRPLHDDPEDKLALTPGDFLVGSLLLAVPGPDISQAPAIA
ncbi:uncharacterized protein LOC118741819 [Rhagoletis pomonella]|uniref:uncharacterized protein LOC118741819 n=1 Tax=Rhagoletis pomonella TaxID=28610 RepID=UPI001781385E|nr:uncharacterized protein LOC118741819 [Rhagoletis pomonella]